MKLKGRILAHNTLGISLKALGALLATRAMLEYGVLEFNGSATLVPDRNIFNMQTFGEQHECSAVGCIGGYMTFLTDRHHHYLGIGGDDTPDAMSELFFPDREAPWVMEFHTITLKQSIQAIDNYLTTGHARWDKVLPEQPRKRRRKKATPNNTRKENRKANRKATGKR